MTPLRDPLARAITLALALGSGASPAAAAGASTFENAERIYPREQLRLEDIPVPDVEVLENFVLPQEVQDGLDKGPEVEIRSYEIVGATLIPNSEIRALLAPYLGKGRRIGDIQEARSALQAEYERRGFPTVAVSLPKQTLLDGRIRIEVLEARIGYVKIDNPGHAWFSEESVRRATPHLRPGAIVRSEDLQEDMRRANRPRDRTVTPVLQAGSEPGTVDVELKVDDSIPLHGSVTWNNYHTPGTPRQRMTAQISYDNLWQLEHQISGAFTFVPSFDSEEFDDVEVFVLSYGLPMPWSDRQQMFAYAAWSDTESILPTQTGINSLGNGFTTGLRYSLGLPLIPGLDWFDHSLTLGFDYKSVENTLREGLNSIRTPIRYLPWTVGWTGTAAGSQGFISLNAGVDFHFQCSWSPGCTEDFQNNRGGIRPTNTVDGTWRVYSFDLKSVVRLPGLLTTLGQGRFVPLPPPTLPLEDDAVLDVAVSGQYADEALVSTEQFPVGGRYSVRGYLDGERFGDHGVNLQAEVRSRALYDFAGGLFGEKVQGIAFYDLGEFWLRGTEKGRGIDAEGRLQSVGVGLRAQLWNHVRGEAFYSYPFEETENTARRGQFQFQVRAEF